MLTVPENLPPAYIAFLEAQDEDFAETVLMVMKQSVAEGKYGILVSDHTVDRQAELSQEVPFGEVVEGTR
ncbi:hypothetical protein [Arthrobacter sp. B0490]|uniref:hypothetical protein n=1 Tax=Arthrobacter sp. B0490 TaxID=2058891 RepID=UPI000CE56BE0|nr:hypothetical protein [Arthrobacter sp. B0490]